MPKFTMKDVDKRIEEIRASHRQPKPGGNDLLTKFQEIAKKRKMGGIIPPIPRQEI